MKPRSQQPARSSALTPDSYSVLSPGTCAALEVRPVTAATRHRRTSPDYRKRFSIQFLFPNRTTSLPWDDTLRLLRSRRTEVPQLRRLELCQVTLPSKCPAHFWLIGEKAKRAVGGSRADDTNRVLGCKFTKKIDVFDRLIKHTVRVQWRSISFPRFSSRRWTYGVSIGIFFPSRSFNKIRTSEMSRQPALLNSTQRRLHSRGLFWVGSLNEPEPSLSVAASSSSCATRRWSRVVIILCGGRGRKWSAEGIKELQVRLGGRYGSPFRFYPFLTI